MHGTIDVKYLLEKAYEGDKKKIEKGLHFHTFESF